MSVRVGHAHRILRVSYQLDVLECSCGATMRAQGALDWQRHRSEHGMTDRGHGRGTWRRDGPRVVREV